MTLNVIRVSAYAFLFLALYGCAVTNTFVNYNSRSVMYKSSIDLSVEGKALADLNKRRRSADKQLYLAERGRIAQLAGMIEESVFDFNDVIEAIRIEDEKAKIAFGSIGARAGTVFTNDSVVPYSMDDYEKVMLHHYQALNYIALGDVSAAGVEVRRANFLQNEALELRAKELSKVEKNARLAGVDFDGMRMADKLSSISDAVGHVKNSFQNAYTFYLSALVYEALGSDNDAYIDYRKSLEIHPSNTYIQDDVLRLSKRLGMIEDYNRFKHQFNREGLSYSKANGSVVVFFENGYAPQKVADRIDFPNFSSGGVVSVAMPFYNFRWRSPALVSVVFDGNEAKQAELVLDISALAAKSLSEELPGMVMRQFVRAVAKHNLQKKVAKEKGDFAGMAMTIFNMATEVADLRTWSTLPSSVQILRSELSAGDHDILVNNNGRPQKISVNVKPGKTSIVYITDTGLRQISRVYNL